MKKERIGKKSEGGKKVGERKEREGSGRHRGEEEENDSKPNRGWRGSLSRVITIAVRCQAEQEQERQI